LFGKIIEEILIHHLPQGVFSEIYGGGQIGQMLANESINLIAFTGSTKTGQQLYELAGKRFIKAIMELGGSAPGIIFDDANLDLTLNNACANRLANQGQCCDGLKRLIVHEKVFDAVVKMATANFAAKKIGPAEDPATQMGPLVAKRQLDLIEAQVNDATFHGATIVTGGHSLEKKLGGAFFEPTIITGVTNRMRVWNEEVFGPVMPIVKFKTDQETIDLANDTGYGLGAYLYTQSKERASKVAGLIQTGMVSINGVSYIRPQNPFGGYKKSGFGREHGPDGFHEVTQIKVVARNK